MTLQGWKTFSLNILVGATMLLTALFPGAELPGIDQIAQFVDQTAAWVVSALAFANILLRAVTSTSIFTSNEQ